jgi:hypothetical protein
MKFFIYNDKIFVIDYDFGGWNEYIHMYTLDDNLKPGKKESWHGLLSYYFIPDESNRADTMNNKFLVFNNVLYYN